MTLSCHPFKLGALYNVFGGLIDGTGVVHTLPIVRVQRVGDPVYCGHNHPLEICNHTLGKEEDGWRGPNLGFERTLIRSPCGCNCLDLEINQKHHMCKLCSCRVKSLMHN